MCGVIGYLNSEGKQSKQDLDLLEEIMWQSQIRGKHASGVSFIENDHISTVKGSYPIRDLLSKVDLTGKCAVIAHARYSTSDLRYNQPISDDDLSIVHNGVVTQEDPSKWHERFGFNCVTANDSELIFRASKEELDPLSEFNRSSMAVIELTSRGILFYRNGNRPLWYSIIGKSVFIASTKNILERAFSKFGITQDLIECINGATYSAFMEGGVTVYNGSNDLHEWQNPNLECVKRYKKVV